MSADHSIPPFPENIDRDAFGHWLSGFTDGEGCFSLATNCTRRPLQPLFRLGLRGDDAAILNLVWSYLRCGAVRLRQPRTQVNPVCSFEVWNTTELAQVVVPHFDRFPLRSKKARDFVIWREAVLILADGLNRDVQHVKGFRGCLPKWTEAERAHLIGLSAKLKAVRAYV